MIGATLMQHFLAYFSNSFLVDVLLVEKKSKDLLRIKLTS